MFSVSVRLCASRFSDGGSNSAVFTCIGAGPGHPQLNGAPRSKVLTGFPLQLIFAKVKAEN